MYESSRQKRNQTLLAPPKTKAYAHP